MYRQYDGQSVYIAFRHYESTAAGLYGIYLDDIVLSDGSSQSSKNVQANNKIEGLELPAGTYYIAASATDDFTVNIKEYVAPGDTWENAVDVTGFPFSHEPDFAYLKENYQLPGETADGADVVYRLTLDEPTTITQIRSLQNHIDIAYFCQDTIMLEVIVLISLSAIIFIERQRRQIIKIIGILFQDALIQTKFFPYCLHISLIGTLSQHHSHGITWNYIKEEEH